MIYEDNEKLAKYEIARLLFQSYGHEVGELFVKTHSKEILPNFVKNSYVILEMNNGRLKALDQLDAILTKYGIAMSSYD